MKRFIGITAITLIAMGLIAGIGHADHYTKKAYPFWFNNHDAYDIIPLAKGTKDGYLHLHSKIIKEVRRHENGIAYSVRDVPLEIKTPGYSPQRITGVECEWHGPIQYCEGKELCWKSELGKIKDADGQAVTVSGYFLTIDREPITGEEFITSFAFKRGAEICILPKFRIDFSGEILK